jgi:hypothetical protein
MDTQLSDQFRRVKLKQLPTPGWLVALTLHPYSSTSVRVTKQAPDDEMVEHLKDTDFKRVKGMEVSAVHEDSRRLVRASHLVNFHLSLNTFEFKQNRFNFATMFLEQFQHPGRTVDFFGQINLIPSSAALHPRSDIHRLAEIINAVVESHCNRRASVDPNF